MNGHPRDQIDTDLAAGRPTLSPIADPLVSRVERLSTGRDVEALHRELEERVGRSPAFLEWARTPTRFLSEFDPATAVEIEAYLAERLVQRTAEARSRGWEVDDEGRKPHDIQRR